MMALLEDKRINMMTIIKVACNQYAAVFFLIKKAIKFNKLIKTTTKTKIEKNNLLL
jgi:hypothetical protein